MKERLYTERLVMRKWVEADAKNLYEYAKILMWGLLQVGRHMKI